MIIKFNAWCQVSRKMLRVKEIRWGYPTFVRCYTGEVDKSGDPILGDFILPILLQYTGLDDKKGIEIYTGDIYQWLGHGVGRKNGKCIQFRPKRIEVVDGTIQALSKLDNILSHGDEHQVIRIGNIYENPELLKQPQK